MYMSETHDGKLKSFGIRLAFLTVISCTEAMHKQRAYQIEDVSEKSSLTLDSYRPATIFPCLKVTASSKCEFKIGNLPLAGHPENHFQSKVKFVGFQNWPILTKRDKIESFGHPFHHSKFLNPTPLCKQFAIQTRKAFASSWSIRVDRDWPKEQPISGRGFQRCSGRLKRLIASAISKHVRCRYGQRQSLCVSQTRRQSSHTPLSLERSIL